MRAALATVVLAALIVLPACGGGGGASFPKKPTVEGPLVQGSKGVWIFRPAGRPKRLVIFFHGQGGPTEATPLNHRAWIDHLVARGDEVVYPRYETDYSAAVLDSAVAGVSRASKRLGPADLPVLALGYSRGAALAVEYAAVAGGKGVPVPGAVESVNPVPYGEQGRIVDLRPLRPETTVAVLISDHDPNAANGSTLLLHRLRDSGFPPGQIQIDIAHSHGSFVADHLAPLGSSPAARLAYWAPTDRLLAGLHSTGGSGSTS